MALLPLLLASLALGQGTDDFDIPDLQSQLFRPSVDAQSLRWTDDAGRREAEVRQFARFVVGWVDRPLVVYRIRADEEKRVDLVGGVLFANAVAGAQLGRVRLAIDIPTYLGVVSDVSDLTVGVGDVAVDSRVTLLSQEHGLGLAVSGRVSLPTASLLGLGSPGPTGEVHAIASHTLGAVSLAANLGYRIQGRAEYSNIVWGDQLMLRAGVAYGLSDDTSVGLDIASHIAVAKQAGDTFGAGTPVELLLGGRQALTPDISVDLGMGTGIGFGLGAPRFRLLAGISWAPSR